MGCASTSQQDGTKPVSDVGTVTPSQANQSEKLSKAVQSNVPLLEPRSSLDDQSEVAPEPFKQPEGIATTAADINKRKKHRLASAEDDMYFVNKLLHTSSAAKKIQSSENNEALALYEKSLAFYQQAKQARSEANQQAQAQALSQAKLNLFAALRLLPKGEAHHQKRQREFNERIKTLNTLLSAYKRIKNQQHYPGLNSQIEQAQQAYDEKDYNNAIKLADLAIGKVKRSLIELRDGDTLVRSLSFSSPQQEYEYEIERNNTHQLLVNILLQEKLKSADVANRVNLNMEKAQQLRQQAEELAKQGDYSSAIKVMEKSTQQIVRAIRAAGVYIPG